MREPMFISSDLNWSNIFYSVVSRSGNVEIEFADMARELKKQGKNTQRTIIYCRRLLDCGLMFEFFYLFFDDDQYWPRDAAPVPANRLFHMFHKRCHNRKKN